MPRKNFNLRGQLTAFGLGCVVALGLFCVVIALSNNHNESVVNCNQIELLKSAIRRTIATADAKLGLQGQPGTSYYHTHPGELTKAHLLNQQSLLIFKPAACG